MAPQMEIARWDRMWSLFHRALPLPPVERKALLEKFSQEDASLCQEVERLLTFHDDDGGGVLFAGKSLASLLDSAADAESLVGQHVGPYELTEVLGEGGMGVVYRAEQQEAVRRTVAVKVIRFGLQSREVIARFELERQALAMMDHPGIAKLYDAGMTEDGRPYFAMEEVPGPALTLYADRNSLSVTERIELFHRVCRAVEHAHQRGVLHRDLKPSNILVVEEDGRTQPKIIDFGIAKAISPSGSDPQLSTALGRILGTPEYMSPEQAAMSPIIDSRSDVYSLGVILYELLVGTVPFSFSGKPYPEMIRVLTEEEIPRASERGSAVIEAVAASRATDPEGLRRALSDELDWILLKALDRDRDRRYGSASDLTADIGRFLNHEPIEAGPPGTVYRARKFVRRHRMGVAVAAALLLALLLGLASTLWMAWVATQERQRAVVAQEAAEHARDRSEREAEVAKAVQGFLADMLGAADPAAGRELAEVAREVRVVDVLDDAAEKLDDSFAEQPEIRAALHDTLGRTYRGLGLLENAEVQFDHALVLRRQLFGDRDPRTLASEFQVAALFNDLGRFEAVEPRLRQLLVAQREVSGEGSADTLAVVSLLNDVLLEQGKVAEAVLVYREALERTLESLGPDHEVTLQSMNNLALVLNRAGEADEAVELYRKSLDEHMRVLGEEHPSTLQAVNNLGAGLLGRGDVDEAEIYLRRAVELHERVLGPHHASTLTSLNNLGALLFKREDWSGAEKIFRQALAGYAVTLGEDHPLALVSTANVARAVALQGRLTEAEEIYRGLIEATRRSLPPRHPNVAIYEGGMGVCLFEMKRFSEAETFLLASYAGHSENFGPEHPRTVQAASRLVALYDAWDRPRAAEKYRVAEASSLE
ncbi:MAG: serine/threonine-protein kinase [Thermoanaerobaculia bacterium]|nr:serine/threonine-protein kinase [Thermoanaerobaculia bacterium]